MISEHLRVMDECELHDVQNILDDARIRIQELKILRPSYVELGPALIYLAKVDDMIEIALHEVRS